MISIVAILIFAALSFYGVLALRCDLTPEEECVSIVVLLVGVIGLLSTVLYFAK